MSRTTTKDKDKGKSSSSTKQLVAASTDDFFGFGFGEDDDETAFPNMSLDLGAAFAQVQARTQVGETETLSHTQSSQEAQAQAQQAGILADTVTTVPTSNPNTLPPTAKPVAVTSSIPTPVGVRMLLVPTQLIRPNPYQTRQEITEESVSDLVEQFRSRGPENALEQYPKATTRSNADTGTSSDEGQGQGQEIFILINGHRRFVAWEIAFPGLPMPLIVKAGISDRDLILGNLVENLTRTGLSEVEYARGFRALLDKDPMMRQEDLARLFSLTRSNIVRMLRLLNLPHTLQEENRLGRLSLRTGVVLARFASVPGAAEYAYEVATTSGLSAEEVEKAGWELLKGWAGWDTNKMPDEAKEQLLLTTRPVVLLPVAPAPPPITLILPPAQEAPVQQQAQERATVHQTGEPFGFDGDAQTTATATRPQPEPELLVYGRQLIAMQGETLSGTNQSQSQSDSVESKNSSGNKAITELEDAQFDAATTTTTTNTDAAIVVPFPVPVPVPSLALASSSNTALIPTPEPEPDENEEGLEEIEQPDEETAVHQFQLEVTTRRGEGEGESEEIVRKGSEQPFTPSTTNSQTLQPPPHPILSMVNRHPPVVAPASNHNNSTNNSGKVVNGDVINAARAFVSQVEKAATTAAANANDGGIVTEEVEIKNTVDSLGLLALQMGLGLLISNTSQEVFDKVISPRWQRLSSQQSNGSSSSSTAAYPTRQEQANAWHWTSNLDFDTLVWLYAELIIEQWLWESRIYKRNEADSETLGWLMTKLRDREREQNRGREAKSYDFSPPVARQMR